MELLFQCQIACWVCPLWLWLKSEGVCCAEFHRCDRHGRRLPCLEGEWTSCQISPSLRISILISDTDFVHTTMCSQFLISSSAAFLVQVFFGSGIIFSHFISCSFKISKWNVSDIGTHRTSWSGQFLPGLYIHILNTFYHLINPREVESYSAQATLLESSMVMILYCNSWLSCNSRAGICSLSTIADWLWAHLLQCHAGLSGN